MTNIYSDPIKNTAELDETHLGWLVNDFEIGIQVYQDWEDAECANCEDCEACEAFHSFAWDEVNAYMPSPADGCYDFEVVSYEERLQELKAEYAARFDQ